MKRIYNQPATQVMPVVLESIVLAGSPAASSGKDKINNIETNDQW
jgi:hypothetical protein